MSTRKPKAPEDYMTAAEVSNHLGINRTTLVRMHNRGEVAECKVWKAKPQPHRIYDKLEVAAVAKALEKNQRGKAPEGVKLI